jgi:2-C-methyl-D-erythritol 4-phosphate cytidylyltransferase
MVSKAVIIAAGGIGSRMASDIPKQFLLVNDIPIIIHTINQFHKYDNNIHFIIALPQSGIDYWKNNISDMAKPFNYTIVEGGKERFFSIQNALLKLNEEYVAVHDAVRPFASLDLIKRSFAAAIQYGNSIPVTLVTDSLRLVENNVSISFDRNKVRAIQTPQCFKSSMLKESYQQTYNPLFTDDASVIEAYGKKVHLIEGEKSNIKITTPLDLDYAKWYKSKYMR